MYVKINYLKAFNEEQCPIPQTLKYASEIKKKSPGFLLLNVFLLLILLFQFSHLRVTME